MTMADFDTFHTELAGLAAVIGRRMPEDLAAVYFRELSEWSLEAVVRELRRRIRTVESGARMPTPAELRQALAGTGRAARGLTEAEAGRVRERVAVAMDEWEHEGAVGSAWPTFELAWQAACLAEELARAATPQNRQDAWQRWLSHGAVTVDASPIATRAQVEAIYRQVAPRCSPLFAKALREIADRIHAARDRARDPGEEG
jgi:hypothetical protein